MPADAKVKDESVPAMPAGSYAKKEEEVPAMPLDAKVKVEASVPPHVAGTKREREP